MRLDENEIVESFGWKEVDIDQNAIWSDTEYQKSAFFNVVTFLGHNYSSKPPIPKTVWIFQSFSSLFPVFEFWILIVQRDCPSNIFLFWCVSLTDKFTSNSYLNS